jgi:hypothetical protein
MLNIRLATSLVLTELLCLLSSGPQDTADSPHVAAIFLQVLQAAFSERATVRAMIILKQSRQFIAPHMSSSIGQGLCLPRGLG